MKIAHETLREIVRYKRPYIRNPLVLADMKDSTLRHVYYTLKHKNDEKMIDWFLTIKEELKFRSLNKIKK